MATAAQVKAHRRDVRALAALAENDLRSALGGVTSPDGARDALMDVLPPLMDLYGSGAATLGADWYDDLRDAAGGPGAFRAIPAELPTRGRAEALARWSVSAMYRAEPDLDTTLVKASGGMQRIIANADRESIRASAIEDDNAGWVRVGSGACSWCQQYLDGEIHYVEGYDFNAHDFCNCMVVPAFDGAAPPPIRVADPDEAAEKAIPEVVADIAETQREVVQLRSSTFAAEDLRAALDPSRKRTAAAVKADLEKTPAGKDLAAAIKGFTETRGGVANLRKNIEKTIDGTAGDAARAKAQAFVDAMNTYPTEDVPALFRGFAVKVEENTNAWWDAFEGQFQPGKRFSLNASSFSSSEKKAAEFEKMIGGTKRAGANHTAVRYVLEGDVHALPVEQLSKFKSEKEWISGGEFEVVDYQAASPKQPYYRVVIRQVKSLEVPQ